jgi:hypothetical protein
MKSENGLGGAGRRPGSLILAALKWTPLLAVPFGVLLAESWLRVQTLHLDYKTVEFRRQIKELTLEINKLEERADQLVTMKRVEEKASDLALESLKPDRIELIYWEGPQEAELAPTPKAPQERVIKPVRVATRGHEGRP